MTNTSDTSDTSTQEEVDPTAEVWDREAKRAEEAERFAKDQAAEARTEAKSRGDESQGTQPAQTGPRSASVPRASQPKR